MPKISMGPIASLAVLIEDAGIWKVAYPDEAHIPFSKAFNGFSLGFVIPDSVIWLAILLSVVYSAFKLGVF